MDPAVDADALRDRVVELDIVAGECRARTTAASFKVRACRTRLAEMISRWTRQLPAPMTPEQNTRDYLKRSLEERRALKEGTMNPRPVPNVADSVLDRQAIYSSGVGGGHTAEDFVQKGLISGRRRAVVLDDQGVAHRPVPMSQRG
jgi:hypothetical protein